MATFEKRASGWWQAKIRRKGHPFTSKTFPTKSAAEAWARSVEADMDRGAYRSAVEAESTTFNEIADRYEKEFAPHHYRGKAWRHKLAHLRAGFGDYFIAALTPARVAEYRDARLAAADPRYKDPATAPRLSPATVKTELDLLSKVLDVASKEFSIPLPAGNPVAAIRKPASSKARDRRLTPEEWARLMDECDKSGNAWLKPAVLLSVETGMRQGELLAANWKDVHITRRHIMLHDTKNGESRAALLTSAAVAILESLPRSLKGGRVIPQDRMTLYCAFKRAAERAGISDYRWHDLRREAISRLSERGDLSLIELATFSGHKTLQMLKPYSAPHIEKLARKIG